MATQRTCWAIIPAAGSGSRMGKTTPKQYLPLAGKTVIEHTLRSFYELEVIHGIVVVLAESDKYWNLLPPASHRKIHTITGGIERCHSVLNGLQYLGGLAHPDDLVLVHDAARPCVRTGDVLKLIEAASDSPDGAVLAVPVRDTMKRANTNRSISGTVSRENLWHALTPQAFRLSVLREALQQAISRNILVTDDAQAVELLGLHPLLVEGHVDNIKITQPSDLALTEIYLTQQERLI